MIIYLWCSINVKPLIKYKKTKWRLLPEVWFVGINEEVTHPQQKSRGNSTTLTKLSLNLTSKNEITILCWTKTHRDIRSYSPLQHGMLNFYAVGTSHLRVDLKYQIYLFGHRDLHVEYERYYPMSWSIIPSGYDLSEIFVKFRIPLLMIRKTRMSEIFNKSRY